MTMPGLLVITNIPSPYRVHELRVLAGRLRLRGVHLEVRFMARSERDRRWNPDPRTWGFRARIARGFTFYGRDHAPVHVNPGLVLQTLTSQARWVLLGGAWYQPAAIAPLVRPRRRSSLLFWNENVTSDRTRLSERARRVVLPHYDGFVVPGERAEAYVRRYASRPVLRLANFVDESLYRDRVRALRADPSGLRARWDLAEDAPVFLWPARLHARKGILPFLRSICDVLCDYVIAIAGEGPQRVEVERFIHEENASNVRLLGHLGEDSMLELYAAADALLLPSLFEPFGFVAVEALWAGLPILISALAGAAPETVVHGQNGWIVDPTDPEDSAATFARAVDLGRSGLAEMGRRSLDLATERFTSERAAEGFVAELLERFPP
jgi:glycosyltransferase involved in cell wall biosynthesis